MNEALILKWPLPPLLIFCFTILDGNAANTNNACICSGWTALSTLHWHGHGVYIHTIYDVNFFLGESGLLTVQLNLE